MDHWMVKKCFVDSVWRYHHVQLFFRIWGWIPQISRIICTLLMNPLWKHFSDTSTITPRKHLQHLNMKMKFNIMVFSPKSFSILTWQCLLVGCSRWCYSMKRLDLASKVYCHGWNKPKKEKKRKEDCTEFFVNTACVCCL